MWNLILCGRRGVGYPLRKVNRRTLPILPYLHIIAEDVYNRCLILQSLLNYALDNSMIRQIKCAAQLIC